jgi:radical SAM superfamily enzyme YgiQ (UPF0313 family)
MSRSRILVVRLPCRKIYPIGPVYLLSLLKRAAPELSLRLLDLALIDPGLRMSVTQDVIREFRPDVIAFSWRDIQVFSPQDMDGGMRDAFTFFYDPSPLLKARAAVRGLMDIFSYRSALSGNLSLIRHACKVAPTSLVAVGGPAVRVFGALLRPRLPERVHVLPDIEQFLSLLAIPAPEHLDEPMIDLEAVENAFPLWTAYSGQEIGVQTKRGCPLGCLYCLYGFLEGREVRRRRPENVVREIEGYHGRWGARRFWFTDAQLLSDPKDDDHLEAILGSLANSRLDLSWSGYMRIDRLKSPLAGLMVKTGLRDLEIALNSGAQSVVDRLRMGFSVEEVMEGFKVLKAAGYAGRIMIDLSLNSPGETRETLRETLDVFEKIRRMFGPDRVTPVIFFLAIQPHTGLEKEALEDGVIKKGYDPLSVWPWHLSKLIYNPPPLGTMIGRCCALAFRDGQPEKGNTILSNLEAELDAK